MSTQHDDGGPRKPWEHAPDFRPFPSPYKLPPEPMSLRDYFAAHALIGLSDSDDEMFEDAGRCAEWAYTLADWMLKAREEKP